MYLDQPATEEALLKIIRTITHHETLADDLLQEALIHLWFMETRRPDQTKSWYLQSCKFHLLHYLSAGRSVDSAKRRNGQLGEIEVDRWIEEEEQVDADAAVFASVCARDLMSALGAHLAPQERAVLQCLADGLGVREIGRELGISHSMAIKHRRKIAALLRRLEKPPLRRIAIPATKGHQIAPALSHTNGKNGRVKGNLEQVLKLSPARPALNSAVTPQTCRRPAIAQSETALSRRTTHANGDCPKHVLSEVAANRVLDIGQKRSLMAAYERIMDERDRTATATGGGDRR